MYIHQYRNIDNKNRGCLVLSFLVLPLRLLYQPRMDFLLLGLLQNGLVPLLTSVSEKTLF